MAMFRFCTVLEVLEVLGLLGVLWVLGVLEVLEVLGKRSYWWLFGWTFILERCQTVYCHEFPPCEDDPSFLRSHTKPDKR